MTSLNSSLPDGLKNIAYTGQKTFKAYFIGLILCLLLTAASFGLAACKAHYSAALLFGGLSVLALLQLLVQSICFLRLNAGKDRAWNLLPFLFTVLIIMIFIGGSLWIMYHLNYSMRLR